VLWDIGCYGILVIMECRVVWDTGRYRILGVMGYWVL
jgi:hypothetical protein